MFNPKLKKYQKKFDYSYSFGAYPTLSLLEYRKDAVLKVLIKEEGRNSDGVSEVIKLCQENNIHFEFNSRGIDKISVKENTYVVGIFKKYDTELDSNSNHIFLVNPSNTGNMGTIVRGMVGFGFLNLGIVKPCVDIFDPMVIRSSMGAFFNINFEMFSGIEEYIEKYPTQNIYTFMLDGSKNILDIEFKEPFTMVHGNEGSGLDEKYSSIGQSVYIPHSKDIDSLNLSVACSIGMWEYGRRK